MIVCRHDNKRHLLNRGDVHSFMERSSLHSAFTDACETDKILFVSASFRHQRADCHRNHRSKMTDHCQLIVTWPATVNVSIPSAHRSLARSEISARNIDKRLAISRATRLIADQWRED